MNRLERRFFPASKRLQDRWAELRAAINGAARQITGKDLAISPFYMHDIPGADAEMDSALVRHGYDAAQFDVQNGIPGYELTRVS